MKKFQDIAKIVALIFAGILLFGVIAVVLKSIGA